MSSSRKLLPANSVGAIVFPAWSDAIKRQRARKARFAQLSPGGIGWQVFAVQRPSRTWLAAMMGIVMAAALLVAAATASLQMGTPQPMATAKKAPLVIVNHEVDLTPPATQTAVLAQQKPAPEASPDANPPPPAQAADVVASEAHSEALDLTGFDITTGNAPRYAGGVTAASGTNTQAVHTRTVDPNARPDQSQGEANLARPVSLSARNWSCPWPRDAESLDINEQTVMLRAVVTAEGRASSVDLLADPGLGFGQAALVCARHARFEPAIDQQGRAYAATSPPIRVRFTR